MNLHSTLGCGTVVTAYSLVPLYGFIFFLNVIHLLRFIGCHFSKVDDEILKYFAYKCFCFCT